MNYYLLKDIPNPNLDDVPKDAILQTETINGEGENDNEPHRRILGVSEELAKAYDKIK